jgi:aminopeptidase YwaD
MTDSHLTTLASHILSTLCVEISDRSVGSPGNRLATTFFAGRMQSLGFTVDSPAFDCIYWMTEGAHLTAGGESFQVFASPYSPGCQVTGASLVAAHKLDELESVAAQGRLLLLHGELAREQLMPKNFPFFNPEEHQRIYRLLEQKKPLAILAATERNPELAGGQYPFPLIEDGDFDIPSVYLTAEEGERLLQHAGSPVSLASASQRIPATGCNVIAVKNPSAARRLVLTAHIDAKQDTSGALDNAAGVVTLLLLAELLHDYSGALGLEIVAVNGEDYYAAPGEIQYLQRNQGKMGDILLNINLDGVGYIQGSTHYSLYECPEPTSSLVRQVFSTSDGIFEGEQWYQGDHMVFVQSGVPALAITTEYFSEICAHITHTPHDTPDKVDPARLASLAHALRDLLLALESFVTQASESKT